MGKESTQHKLDRVRSPRVQITYDLEMGGAIELKELPFVMGVMADLTGNKPGKEVERLTERKFVDIDQDNFDKVMAGMKPGLQFNVDNTLSNDNSTLPIELKFESMEDFTPDRLVNQVDPLRKLLEIRQELAGLLAKTQGNEALSDRLTEIMEKTELQQQVSKEAGLNAGEKA
jgi:type VI secretion system protein ImpB